METEGAHQEQLPQEVMMYLDWFDQADPTEVVHAHQELYQGRITADPIRTMLYNHLQHAISLYPSHSLQTNPGRAAELYASFASSDHGSDVRGMLSVLVNLWNSDPRGATRVIKLCLTRAVREPNDLAIQSVSVEAARLAMQNNIWTDDKTDGLSYLALERIRREPPPSPAS